MLQYMPLSERNNYVAHQEIDLQRKRNVLTQSVVNKEGELPVQGENIQVISNWYQCQIQHLASTNWNQNNFLHKKGEEDVVWPTCKWNSLTHFSTIGIKPVYTIGIRLVCSLGSREIGVSWCLIPLPLVLLDERMQSEMVKGKKQLVERSVSSLCHYCQRGREIL